MKTLNNALNNELLSQIGKPGISREEMERMVYTLYPAIRITGKIRGWIIRWRKGKPIISRQASTYYTSQTKASIENRNSLAGVTFFASPLNKVGLLKEIWNQSSVDGNCSYRKIIKYNKKRLVDNHPSIDNSITPSDYHFDMYAEVSFDSNKSLKISSNSLKSNETLIIVLVPYSPKITELKKFEVVTLVHSLNAGSEIELSAEQMSICSKYNKYILYSAIVRKQGRTLSWSNSAAVKGEFSVEETAVKAFISLFNFNPVLYVKGSDRIMKFFKKAHPPPGVLNALPEAA